MCRRVLLNTKCSLLHESEDGITMGDLIIIVHTSWADKVGFEKSQLRFINEVKEYLNARESSVIPASKQSLLSL